MSMIPPTASLVKYDNPLLVSKSTDRKSKVATLVINLCSGLFFVYNKRSKKHSHAYAIGKGITKPSCS